MTQALQQLRQVGNVSEGVHKMASSINENFNTTADALIKSAEALEARAVSLRKKAEWLIKHCKLGEDLRNAIQYERDCWDEARGLASIAIPDKE